MYFRYNKTEKYIERVQDIKRERETDGKRDRQTETD